MVLILIISKSINYTIFKNNIMDSETVIMLRIFYARLDKRSSDIIVQSHKAYKQEDSEAIIFFDLELKQNELVRKAIAKALKKKIINAAKLSKQHYHNNFLNLL